MRTHPVDARRSGHRPQRPVRGWHWVALGAAALLVLLFVLHQPDDRARARVTGTIDIETLGEASGIVASRAQTGVLWTHNDSSGSARIFALNVSGNLLGTFE